MRFGGAIPAFVLPLVLLAAVPVSAQVGTVDTSAPIVVESGKKRTETFKGEVLFFTSQSMTVRSRENERLIRTFTYAPSVHEQMQKVLDGGGYQHGDRVEIRHEPGSDVALAIKGKPSKPL